MFTRNEPKNASEIEAIVAQRVATLQSSPGIHSTLEVEWRSGKAVLPVIKMPIADLKLNPETHRIRAQRDFDVASDRLVKEDPWGDASQKYIAQLLSALPLDPSRQDPAFEKLRDDLRSHGQKEPGIITPSGILINGNSRCTALRSIDESNMQVAVLPTDWNWEDLASVELDLQMRRDYKRDYSYINFLIAVNESAATVGPDATARAFHLRKDSLDRHLWILALLRDLVTRSKTETGSLNLRDFESDQGKLDELHRTYFARLKEDPAGAEALKESRLIGLLLKKSKTDLRFVSEDFYSTYLKKRLPQGFENLHHDTGSVSIPGLPVSLPVDEGEGNELTAFVTSLAQARVRAGATDPTTSEAAFDEWKRLDEVVDGAIDSAGREARLKKRKVAAIDRLTAASDSVESSVDEIALAKSKNALDEGALNEALIALSESVSRLARSTLRIVDGDGEGFKWLQQIRQAQ